MENQMNNNLQKKELEENSIDIRELLFMVIDRWWIFLISIILCTGAAFLHAKMQTPIYQEEAMILIRDEKAGGNSGMESALFEDLGIFGKGLVLENEIYILQSTPLMSSVVEKLHLQIGYRVNTMFKKKDLYEESPIKVSLFNKQGNTNDISAIIAVNILDDNSYKYVVTIPTQKVEFEGTANFDQVVALDDNDSFSIKKTELYSDEYLNKEIVVSITSTYKKAKALLANLSVSRPDKVTGILNLTMKDSNPLRARRILDTLIAVYNADAIADKNKVAQNTEDFIVNRIHLIYGELGDVDEQVANYKKDNKIPNVEAVADIIVLIRRIATQVFIDLTL